MNKANVEAAINKAIAAMARIEAENNLINTIAEDIEQSEGVKANKVKAWIKAAYKDDTAEKIEKLIELKGELEEYELA